MKLGLFIQLIQLSTALKEAFKEKWTGSILALTKAWHGSDIGSEPTRMSLQHRIRDYFHSIYWGFNTARPKQQFSTLYRMLYNVLYSTRTWKTHAKKPFIIKKFYTVKYNLVKPANIRKEQFLIRGDFSYFQLPFMIGDIEKFIFFP